MTDFLPKKFHFSHDFALYLHDSLAQMIVYGESKRLFDVRFALHSEEHASKFAEVQGEQIWDWLEQNQYNDVIGEMLLKRVFPALLSDFCHFVFEALSCSRKAKLTVTYALLRKPLRENLFYLEWLLADPEGMLNTLYNQPSAELAINKIATPDKALEVIRKTINRLPNSEIYNPEFIYDLRFNKAVNFGFEQLWNKALHLVTTRKHLETESQNFNFVFSDDKSRWSQWNHLYTCLPFLLSYTADICYILMALLLREPYPKYAEAAFHRSMGFILWGIEVHQLRSEHEEVNLPFVGLTELRLDCPRCKREITPDEAQVRSLFENGKARCPHCKHTLLLTDSACLTLNRQRMPDMNVA